MEGTVTSGGLARRHYPVSFGDIPDIVPLIRVPTGARCQVMAMVLRWMLQHGAQAEPVLCPNASNLAKALGQGRQSVAQAFAALVRRGLVVSVPFKGPNGPRWVQVNPLPAYQLSFFAGPE